jgi:protein import protein ZIM17
MRPSQKLVQHLLVTSKPISRTRYLVPRTSIFAACSPASRFQTFPKQSRAFSQAARLHEDPITSSQDPNASSAPPAREPPKVPSYEMTFTCKPCSHRSTHRISKQGYHHGTVLITCPDCKNRHVITDHLRVFNDRAKSFEEILMERAAPGTELSSLLKKGTLGFKGMTVNGQKVPMAEEEAIEFWEEGREASEAKHREEYKKGKVW